MHAGHGDAGLPLFFRVLTMVSRFFCESAMGRPRMPSLPPNSTTTSSGFQCEDARSTRARPSLVVSPADALHVDDAVVEAAGVEGRAACRRDSCRLVVYAVARREAARRNMR